MELNADWVILNPIALQSTQTVRYIQSTKPNNNLSAITLNHVNIPAIKRP